MIYDVQNEWKRFTDGHEDVRIRSSVLDSWKKSTTPGASPHGTPPFSELHSSVVEENPIINLAKSLIERVFRNLDQLRLSWIICGNELEIIEMNSYNTQFNEFLNNSGLKKGVSLEEKSSGTNAFSMAAAANHPEACEGAEHYYQCLHNLAGAAAPFYDSEGTQTGYLGMLGMLPDVNSTALRGYLRLIISVIDREIRLIRSKTLHEDLKIKVHRLYKEDNKPIVIVNRNGYLRLINPAAMKLLKADEKLIDEKNLDKIASFTPLIKKLAQSAIPSNGKKMEIRLKEKHLDIVYEKNPIFSEKDEFLGCIFVFHEKTERPSKENSELLAKYTFEDIIGRTPRISMAKDLAARVAGTSVNVLLSGPSGTGKEMFAQSIHNASERKNYPFVAINCAAIPGEIAESELFGYSPGSFTGANRKGKPGKLEAADKGTVFLDEIGDMPMELQAKLLRVLEDREITRIGDSKSVPVNIRIIAATNKNIPELIEKGEFREDLYYRINVSSIRLPSLADSRDDIPELAENFIDFFNEVMGKKVRGVAEGIMDKLKNYSWPGNIRELRNTIEFAVMLNKGEGYITWKDMPGQLRMSLLYSEPENNENSSVNDPLRNARRNFEDSEKALYEKAIRMSKGNMTRAAEILDVGRSTLYRKIKKFNIKH